MIEAVAGGASRRGAGERFEVSASSSVRWLQRWHASGSAAPKPRGGSVSPLEEFAEQILALIAERPDLTLVETVAELRRRRIRTSRSALSRFFHRHDFTFKKKACKPPSENEQTSPEHADVGSESKGCLTPPGWCFSTKLRSLPAWCGSEGALRGA